MIRVRFTEPAADPKWTKWKADGAKKVAQHVADVQAGRKPRISDALYKRMRDVIFDAFHGKCAYCEAKFVLDQSGDVEHYRPKGQVSDENWQVVQLPGPSGQPKPHPGYYWLAYDWRNLLPSCARCNRPTKTSEGVVVGKGTRFPVGKAWAADDAGIAGEEPRFLHPVLEDPGRHLIFDPVTGVVGWKTRRGRACVELLDLNREGLPEARRQAYTSAVSDAVAALVFLSEGNLAAVRQRVEDLDAYRLGTRPYSFAGRRAVRDRRAELRRARDAL